jgi:AcrR family transcriptional regulator
MSVKSRQAKNAAATRAALLRVARKLFAERGYGEAATEEVVRRARVTRGALYHHFRDKRDLFKAVLDEEQMKMAASIKAVAARQGDPWRSLIAGCHAFLDACLDPAVQQILLIDAPAVLGWEGCRESDAMYYLDGVKMLIQAAIDQRIIPPQPVDALARVILGALNEAAMLIAHADDEQAARRDVSDVVDKLLGGIRSAAGDDRKRAS